MNTKTFLVGFVAVLAIFLMSFASAGNLTSQEKVFFNDVKISDGIVNIAGFSGETVPVEVIFTAGETSEDVKVRVEVYSGRYDFEATTDRFNVIEDNVYRKLLAVELPSDLKDTTKNLTLKVRVYDADHDTVDFDEDYVIKMQRESYGFDILSVDYSNLVLAGDIVPVSVVVENIGMQELENGYVIVSIDELGVSSKGYFGDLVAVENCDDNCDDEDSVQKTIYIKIPENTEDGIYTLTTEVYNKDARTVATGLIRVEASISTQVLAGVKSQDMKAGETKVFDLIIVNSGSDVGVYNIKTISGSNLDVSAPSVVTVGPESSTSVPVSVTASRNADVGSYTFSVDVNGKQVIFGINITDTGASTSVVALTVVLVIVFLVLLAVLIVLLTRKEKPVEEAETSYY